MPGKTVIETGRLMLRTWAPGDLAEFVRITNTPAVMRHLGGVQGPEMYQAFHDHVQACQRQHGFSFWIAERREDGATLGMCGFKRSTGDPLTRTMEIGWRLRQEAGARAMPARRLRLAWTGAGATWPMTALSPSR